MLNRIFILLLFAMMGLCNCTLANIVIDSEAYMHDGEEVTILPVYHDPCSIDENFTTDVCHYVWNGEAFSGVWPQSRKELWNLILSLRSAKKNFHLLHILTIVDSLDNHVFEKNIDHLREALIVSSLLEIPVMVSLADKDAYTTIAPSYIGPEAQYISIHPKHIEWLRDGETLTCDFKEAQRILQDFISAQKEACFSLKWIPAQDNVVFLMELLKKLNMLNRRYTFDILFIDT